MLQFPKTPILSNLKEYSSNHYRSFHTPGHQNGKLIKLFKEFSTVLNSNLFEIDSSISCEELDSVHDPQGVIKEATELASKTFNSDKTFFVVGGSTLSNIITVFSMFSRGDTVLVARNLHKSIWAAIQLRELKPIFVPINYHGDFPLNVHTKIIFSYLEKFPEAKGVIITSPSYDGISANLEGIAGIVHKRNIPLIVDESWGAHFHFSKQLPKAAMDSGADVSIQSTHKILGSLSQTSMIHIRSKFANLNQFQEFYNYFTTTSPFYPFLASLDFVRALMDYKGAELVSQLLSNTLALRKLLLNLKNFKVISEEIIEGSEFELDSTKVLIHSNGLGYFLADKLKNEYSTRVEKADIHNVLILITIAHTFDDIISLAKFIQNIDEAYSEKFNTTSPKFDKANQNVVRMPIEKSENCVAAEMVVPYPPGIPLVLPGETLTKETITQLKLFKENKVEVHNISDKTLSTIKVFEPIQKHKF